jgi:hypothetical protein
MRTTSFHKYHFVTFSFLGIDLIKAAGSPNPLNHSMMTTNMTMRPLSQTTTRRPTIVPNLSPAGRSPSILYDNLEKPLRQQDKDKVKLSKLI